jgi:glycosyltransferase involved in cell wall biosynthesis
MDEFKPLRIGLCIDRWDPERGGAERALSQLAAWLEARGHRVFAFGLEKPERAAQAPAEFVRVKTHGWTRGSRERNLAAAMLQAARERQCHVTLGVRHMPEVDVLWPHGGCHRETMLALSLRNRGRHRAFLRLEREALEGGASRVLCVSDLVRDEMLKHYPQSAARLRVIPNGVDLQKFHVGAREESRRCLNELGSWAGDAPLMTFVARNPQLKGVDVLLEALQLMQGDPWSLMIAGPRDVRPLQRRAQLLFVDPLRVAIQSQVDPVTLAAGADLLVHPSRRDSSALVVLEALACGTPALVSKCVGAQDAITCDDYGQVFPTDIRPPALAKLLQEQLARHRERPVAPATIAVAVAQRGISSWLGHMEHQLLEIAQAKALSSPHE